MVAIVEDDAAMRKSVEHRLQAHGYATTAFTSAGGSLLGAVNDIAVGPVTDIHFGGMSGIELCRRLRAAGSKIPIVFITALDNALTLAAALAVGCVDYLQKPVEPSRLVQALERSMRS